MAVEVRVLVNSDVGDACALLNAIIDIGGTTAYEKRVTSDEFDTWFLSAPRCLACLAAIDSDGALVGFQSLARKESLPDRWADIATFARSRPKLPGVGRVLFGRTRTIARSLGITTINATIRADNVPGLAYYTRMGFIEYAVTKDVPLQNGTLVDRISHRYDHRGLGSKLSL